MTFFGGEEVWVEAEFAVSDWDVFRLVRVVWEELVHDDFCVCDRGAERRFGTPPQVLTFFRVLGKLI